MIGTEDVTCCHAEKTAANLEAAKNEAEQLRTQSLDMKGALDARISDLERSQLGLEDELRSTRTALEVNEHPHDDTVMPEG